MEVIFHPCKLKVSLPHKEISTICANTGMLNIQYSQHSGVMADP